MTGQPDGMTLRPGERLRAVYRPNDHSPANPDPRGTIEQFRTIGKALSVFEERARNGASLFYPAGTFGHPKPCLWHDADGTGSMDVWVEVPEPGEEPMPPDCYWQRWTWVDGTVQRDDF